MNKLFSKIEFITNILIIVAIIGIAGFYIKRSYFPSNQAVISQPAVGSKINVAGLDFSKQSKTLVMALQTTCHYCNESADFYKKLIQSVQGKNTKLVAVFPGSIEESKAHLDELGLSSIDIDQAPLNTLPVNGTPTLILTNDKGEIMNAWIGKLPENKELEVINSL